LIAVKAKKDHFGRPNVAEVICKELNARRDIVARLAGPYGADWAISQLSTDPHFVQGWPAPCKAARMRIRKAAR
jgi:hypothetical protein